MFLISYGDVENISRTYIGTIRQVRRYRIRKNREELFGYYRKKHPKLFDKQKLYTYEELKHRAVYDLFLLFDDSSLIQVNHYICILF